MKKYIQYSVEDFVLDDAFRRWVLNEDALNDAFWREWITTHPDMQPVVDEARQIILGLQTERFSVGREEIDAGYREVEAFFDQSIKRKSRWFSKGFWRIAAAVLALVVAGLGVLYQHQPHHEVKQYITRQGQHRKVQLPDGSRVYMKGNSQLTYSVNWDETRERRVELQGEAYFQVREKQYEGNKTKFIVAANEVSIEVVGTEFMVRSRSSKTHVALNSGKIKLQVPQNSNPLNMNPGDVVEYNASNRKLVSRKKKPRDEASWMNRFESESRKKKGDQAPQETKADQSITRGDQVQSGNAERSNASGGSQGATTRSSNNWKDQYNQEQKAGASPAGEKSLQVNQSSAGSRQGGGAVQGGNRHYIIQDGKPITTGEGNNLSEVVQEGDQNTAYIEQIGEGLRSRQEQVGNQNRAEAVFEGPNVKGPGDQLSWSTHQVQEGTGNVSVFRLMESYNTNIYSRQIGNKNEARVESRGTNNTGIILQEGAHNRAVIHQQGAGNQAAVVPYELEPGIVQEGRYNNVQVDQQGRANKTQSIQEGSYNEINVDQNGQ